VDHFQPRANGGSDESVNLLYCCYRCNLYKADYWPAQPADPRLWNPRAEAMAVHLLTLADGTLHPITPVGDFTLRRLRLNRPELVAYRLRQLYLADQHRLLARYHDLVGVLHELQRQQEALLQEQHALLAQQRAWLRQVRGGKGS